MKNNSLQNRSIYHDLLRILATFAVICIHVCAESATWQNRQILTSSWFSLNVFDSLSRFAVPVFVMLSGSFMVERFKETDLKKLYTKNIFRLVCAFVFWSTAYVAVDVLKDIFMDHQAVNIKDVINACFFGEYHLWFIPMMVFLYIITPFVQKICSSLKYERYFVLLSFVPIIFKFVNQFIYFEQINTLFNFAGMEFVSGYTVYFILGHYLTKQDIAKKNRIIIYLFAVVSIIATICLSFKYYQAGGIKTPYAFEYLSPTVYIVAVAVFLLSKYGISKINFKERSTKFIIKLSSLTFGVYLSHMFFVRIFLMTPVTVENIHPIISVPLIVLIVFVLSAITTYVISKIPVLKKYII